MWAISFALAVPILSLFLTRNPLLYDNDSYYHLAIARAYFEEGLLDDLRWARFSAMADGFGDKEVLFHVLLAPFAGLASDPVRGGQIALALLLAAIFATLATAARPALGAWSIVLPWWLAFASTELAWRWVRLRPELLSLLLLLWALQAIGRRRWRQVGVLAVLYALSYTALHAFLALSTLLFLFMGWARRRWEWGLLAYSTAGIGIGVVAHPHFPKNLEIWLLQSFEFFHQLGTLDVGTEILPNYTDVTLMVNLGWAIGLAALWMSSRGAATPSTDADRREGEAVARLADAFGVAAFAFSLLYLLMSRFSLYAMPFATLWALCALRAGGREIGGSTRLPWSRARLPFAVAAAACLAVSLPEALRQWQNYDLRTQAGPGEARLRDREALAAALPAGARVAAPWQQTGVYMLWAPQAVYLNVLDPVFLATHDPVRHAVQRRVFAGEEPDVPLAVAGPLDSPYLAYSPYAGLDLLTGRLDADPRVALRHRLHGFNLLWEMIPGRNAAFLLDWRVLPADHPEPSRRGAELADTVASLSPYPRLPPGPGRELEGYVDTRRFDEGAGCVTLVHPIYRTGSATWHIELAPWGPSRAWFNGEPLVGLAGEPQAILGRGVTTVLELEAGVNLLRVLTCTGREAAGPRGFYLRRIAER